VAEGAQLNHPFISEMNAWFFKETSLEEKEHYHD